jgi:hypothetical protein
MLIKICRQSFSVINKLRLFVNTMDHDDDKWSISFNFIPPTFNTNTEENISMRMSKKSMLILSICDKEKKYERGYKK